MVLEWDGASCGIEKCALFVDFCKLNVIVFGGFIPPELFETIDIHEDEESNESSDYSVRIMTT